MVRHIYFVFVLFIGGACVSKSTKYQDVTVKNVDIEAVKKEFDSKLKTKSSNKEKKESPKKTEKKPTAKK